MDRFGAGVSVVVLMAVATAAFVLRQNLNDHVFYLASGGAASAETTGAAVAK